jgi:hypothetical protein
MIFQNLSKKLSLYSFESWKFGKSFRNYCVLHSLIKMLVGGWQSGFMLLGPLSQLSSWSHKPEVRQLRPKFEAQLFEFQEHAGALSSARPRDDGGSGKRKAPLVTRSPLAWNPAGEIGNLVVAFFRFIDALPGLVDLGSSERLDQQETDQPAGDDQK